MDKKEKIQLGVVVLLAVILLVLSIVTFSKKKPSQEILDQPAPKDDALVTPTGIKKSYQEFKDLSKKNNLKRDPFSGLAIAIDQGPHLNGILWDPQNPTAVMSGQVVKIGSQLQKWKVIEIRKDRVILNDGTINLELMLGQ